MGDRHRHLHFMRQFGITKYDYDRMYFKQDGKCAICGVHQSELKIALAVDHDHETGKIRGLLCGNCNRGLGMFKDDAELMEKAINYLENSCAFGLTEGEKYLVEKRKNVRRY